MVRVLKLSQEFIKQIVGLSYNLRPDGEGTETNLDIPEPTDAELVTTYDPMVRVLKRTGDKYVMQH